MKLTGASLPVIMSALVESVTAWLVSPAAKPRVAGRVVPTTFSVSVMVSATAMSVASKARESVTVTVMSSPSVSFAGVAVMVAAGAAPLSA